RDPRRAWDPQRGGRADPAGRSADRRPARGAAGRRGGADQPDADHLRPGRSQGAGLLLRAGRHTDVHRARREHLHHRLHHSMSAHERYSSPLAERYASRAMLELWSPRMRYGLWRRLWLALAEGERELGLEIPEAAIDQMRAHLDDVDFDTVAAYERR